MAAVNPYGEDLGTRRPLDALAETPGTIRQHVASWGDADFEGTYAPGKWSFRKVLVHLAQTELALTTRARFALSTDNYAAQSFSQDDWMADRQSGERPHRARRLYDAAAVQPGDVASADPRADRSRRSHIPSTAR